MTIAVFKPGGEVWGKLEQRVIDMAELPGHIAEGWFEKAQDALDAHDLAKLEADNVALAAQIAAEQVKLDGRTKAARDLKAKQPEPALVVAGNAAVPMTEAELAALPDWIKNAHPPAPDAPAEPQ